MEDATCVDISILRQNVAALKNKLQRIRKRLDAADGAVTRMGDNFVATMSPFYTAAVQRLDNLVKLRDRTFADLKQLGVWLNEPKDANFKYLKTLNDFRLGFMRGIKSVQQRRAKLIEIEKRKKWAENKRKRKRTKKISTAGRSGNGGALTVNRKDTAREEKNGSDSDDSIEDGTEFVEDNNSENERADQDGNDGNDGDDESSKNKGHRRMNSEKNISDAVIQSLVADSSRTLIRLQSRSKQNRYKLNLYDL